MINITIGKIEGADFVVNGLKAVIDNTPALLRGQVNIIGKAVVEQARAYLGTSGPKTPRWEPIKPVTLKLRKRNKGNTSPLLDTGELRKTIRIMERGGGKNPYVVVGSDHEGAQLLTRGGRASEKSAFPGAYIPPRPFIEPAAKFVTESAKFNRQLKTFMNTKVKELYETGRVGSFTDRFEKVYKPPKLASIKKVGR